MGVEALTSFAAAQLATVADPEKAVPMAAYMKTEQPFYGVPKPARSTIFNEMIDRFAPSDRNDYHTAVLAL